MMLPFLALLTLVSLVLASRYDPLHVQFNLNQNQTATNPLDYWGKWDNHTFNPSPSNWRFPFYTFFLDRFVNGDPSNDNINGTVFEQDVLSNQYRHGGDVAGLADSLDYLQGMGIKGLYVAGSPFLNQPWTADSYSPLDLTILDHHFGTIEEWRTAIADIHRRGMYIVLDNTFGTMGDLLGFEGYLNDTTPFTLKEHDVVWKSDRRYLDFDIKNEYQDECVYPRFWNETGYPIDKKYTDQMKGCYDSDVDHYGDTEAFGVWPDFQRQLSKFASVQDRLREWKPSVREKIQHFSCIAIQMLDIDGFRFDKATQITVDAMADFNEYMRNCAKSVGKDNFFLPGEITGGNTFASIYLGRGRQPDMKSPNASFSTTMTAASDPKYFIREKNKNALDGAAFHYTIYRSLTRFLGMDGNLEAGYDANSGSWVDSWNDMLVTNDFVNPSTNQFDPRHMFGVTNQDVFRWPAIKNGTQRMLLGLYITTLHMPGIPKLTWGEEQAFYVLDSTASNYIYGRQPMTAAAAWQLHGCYALGSTQYYQMPLDAARKGCRDDSVALDHRDASHPIRNIIKHMYFLREQYPVLNDGWFLRQLANQTQPVQYPGSGNVTTETGIWSVVRDVFPETQTLSTTSSRGKQSVWLLYHNANDTTTYDFDCSTTANAMIAAFKSGTTVKNLFYPHDEITLQSATDEYGNAVGCTERVELKMYEFKAYVPKDQFVAPPPMITRFSPGHDARVKSAVVAGSQESIEIEIHFSKEMDCDQITSQMRFNSTTEDLRELQVRPNSVNCSMNASPAAPFVAAIPGVWSWKATLDNVSNGIHAVTVRNATAVDGTFSNSVDRFMFRIGQDDNPMVFPQTANYTRALIHRNATDNTLYISHKAAGADKWRYSLNWASTWSDWQPYRGGNDTLEDQPWSGTKKQKWSDTHVIAQYWGRLSGSSATLQHADLGRETLPARRWPHVFAHGPFNQYGFDAGLKNELKLDNDGRWKLHFMSEWSGANTFQLNVWGMNPDGQPDASSVYGDIDGDGVLDRLPPSSLSKLNLSISSPPPSPYLAYQVFVDDGTFEYKFYPVGDRRLQIILFILLAFIPLISACFAVWIYMRGFYSIKFNEIGLSEKPKFFHLFTRNKGVELLSDHEDDDVTVVTAPTPPNGLDLAFSEKRRTVLIATMEYDIEDWNIKIKIGGLGVMAQLMGKNLEHQDLIWVVPCVGGIDYPVAEASEPMTVKIMGVKYDVSVQYHKLRNITYVLLDAPVFRAQTKSEPYPPRMDDMDSAVYYSAWNQCIAQAIERFPIDLYHINDYHGAAAPLYLLPRTVPCCLSLHNAEFQGLWPMRTALERKEVCGVFNLPETVVEKYIQFGSVFNLLHAGSSYLREHQKGFGAIGVSKKYGKRSWARYAIFWGLAEVGQLPNPDPTDTLFWDKQLPKEADIIVDQEFESGRAELKRQAQEWAGLEQRADAELFVFVGRWSTQKGVDLIADVFPAVLEEHEKVQLICIGPVIDLYGKFAALKLEKMMVRYKGRVCSKPVFTALPPYIFSGAEFALIPSRDEPFGLVAVEFGRKGALGVGARVGGLGQMPGWWYTVESITTSHLLKQFKEAIDSALASKKETRAMMRARSAKQRFPVQQWKEDLEILQSRSMKLHQREKDKGRRSSRFWSSSTFNAVPEDSDDVTHYLPTVMPQLYLEEGVQDQALSSGVKRSVSLGSRRGPGHVSQNSSSTDATLHDDTTANIHDEYIIQMDEDAIVPLNGDRFAMPSAACNTGYTTPERPIPARQSSVDREPGDQPLDIRMDSGTLSPPKPMFMQMNSNRSSLLSLGLVVGERKDYSLQKVDPFFTDANGDFYNKFSSKLDNLNAKNSESELCIEEFLVKSERAWFKRFRDARLGMTSAPVSRPHSIKGSMITNTEGPSDSSERSSFNDEFLLGSEYKPPRLLKKYLQMKIGDWPVYTILLAFGQIIAANSYQITLITGTVGQSAEKLYAIASVYLVTSMVWWLLFRYVKSVYCLSTPFIFYGLAFLLLGFAPFLGGNGKFWMQNFATGLYATASSSGSLFFALNFGDEGGAPVKDWIFRACVIQGTQQLYVAGLWYWGSTLAAATTAGLVKTTSSAFATSPMLATVTTPIAILLWTVGILIQIGLPEFYHQAPGAIPSFYAAMCRRKIVLWTLVTVVLQNFFLSAPYGRNWQFLWSSKIAPAWAVALLFLLFFLFLWIAVLWVFAKLSVHHSWIVPIFAIGLGAPRWCQMLWGTSSIGLYLPWAGGPMSSALVSRSLWLWLGLMDTIQGVGFGMIFLQTLTRMHVAFTLIAAQVLGSVATMVARAVAPNKLGPGDVFPDFSAGAIAGLIKPWFWVALFAQIVICFGFFKFFRKEQLSKP